MDSSASAKAVNEKHAFRIRTVKASPFRILIEALKEILTEANLEIDPNGLKIIAMDGTQTVLVHLRLHSEWFEEFYCPQRVILGLNMINFFKLIKTVSNNESLILSMEKEDTTRLGIMTLNGENQKTTKYHLNLIELDIHPIEIPPVAFQTTITMPSTDFQKVIRDMFGLAETVEIRSAASELVFKCRGDFAENETIFHVGNTMTVKQNQLDIVQGHFSLKHLNMFCKCTSLCSDITLYLKNDYPIIVEYAVAGLGEIKLALAPHKQPGSR